MQNTFLRIAALATLVALPLSQGCASTLEEHRNVSYDDRYGESTTMDVFVPEGSGAHPAVMFIHGGGWSIGSKDEYTQAAIRLAHSGYVTATINYRLAPEGQYPRAVQDCVCALSYLRAHAADYKLDPERVAVMGYSAGGHLASLIGVGTDDPLHAPDCASGPTKPPRAVISGAGPQDLRGKDNGVLKKFFGGGPDEVPDRYAHGSPITHVTAGKPPFLFVNGTSDWFVDHREATKMKDALTAAGNDAQLLEVSGGGHLLNAGTNGTLVGEESDLTPEGWIAVMSFLDRTVGK